MVQRFPTKVAKNPQKVTFCGKPMNYCLDQQNSDIGNGKFTKNDYDYLLWNWDPSFPGWFFPIEVDFAMISRQNPW
jgi:hypothetical protein